MTTPNWPTNGEIDNAIPPVPQVRVNPEEPLARETNQVIKKTIQAGKDAAASVAIAAADYTDQEVGEVLSVVNSGLAGKVDKEAGKGLSQENYTTAEKNKLAGLEGSNYKGYYPSLAALEAAVPVGEEGWYADVDEGVGAEVVRHIWDSSDSAWTPQRGESAAMTGAEVKALYESQPDTNAFTNAEKAKLLSVEVGAQVNDVTEAPLDGKEYARKNGAWSPVVGGGGGGVSRPYRVGRVVEELTGVPSTGLVSLTRLNRRFYVACVGTSGSLAKTYTLKNKVLTEVSSVSASLGGAGWAGTKISDTLVLAVSSITVNYAILTVNPTTGALTASALNTVPGMSGTVRCVCALGTGADGKVRFVLEGSAGAFIYSLIPGSTVLTQERAVVLPASVLCGFVDGDQAVFLSDNDIAVWAALCAVDLDAASDGGVFTVVSTVNPHINDVSGRSGTWRLIPTTQGSYIAANRSGIFLSFSVVDGVLVYNGPSYFTGHNDGYLGLCYVNPTECIVTLSGPSAANARLLSIDSVVGELPSDI